MKPVTYFINTDGRWSDFWIKCGGRFTEVWKKLGYGYYWSLPRRMLLSKVSTKYCTCVINTTVVFTHEKDLWKRHADQLATCFKKTYR